jgi:cystathionine beta-lyase family protein involved in aluminum resistance
LKNSIKTTWKARNTAYVNSVKAIVQELKTPISASAVSMIAHPVETVGTENMIVAASCAAILAVVLGMKSKKASKSIEFEVDCEMVPQKESKKVIKKTLAKIMKNNSAKATLMN